MTRAHKAVGYQRNYYYCTTKQYCELVAFLRRMAACTLHHDAYCVAYLHICRYNSKAVNGVLVGSVDGDSVIVRKAFPLFHAAGALGLAPMLEAALMLVRRI